MYRSSRGFSLIELMVAIGILAILAALSFVGFKVLGTGGKSHTTQTAMEGCKSMVTELEVTGDLKQVQALYPAGFPPVNSGTLVQPIAAPVDAGGNGNISADTYSSAHQIRFTAPAIVQTQAVMKLLQSVPRNSTILTQLSTERFLKKPDGAQPSGTPGVNMIRFDTTGSGQPNPPILVDGWGNPIIFVPAAGLSGVYFKDETNNYANKSAATLRVITSSRVRRAYSTGDTDPTSLTYGNIDPGATAFWASAGPDGDFTKGDDNIYSFEN